MQIQVPQSVQGLTSATVRRWYKKIGEPAKTGDVIVDLETEDAIVQIAASADGSISNILVQAGKTVSAGTDLGSFDPGHAASPAALAPASPPQPKATPPAAGTPILMPQAGNTMEEGTLLKWKVKLGDTVAVGQVLCDIETDKATVEFESTDAGKIAWLAPEGSVVPVKQPIALLGDAPAAPTAAPVTKTSSAAPAVPAPAITPPAGVTPILMPQAGNTMEEGTIIKWRAKVGDQIAVGQVICDIETDKATIEFESTDAGRLAKIVAAEGTVVPVKQPIALLAANDADAAAYLAAGGPAAHPQAQPKPQAAAAPPASVATPAQNAGGRPKASPAARKLASAKGIDLANIPAGSGPEGRILSTDVAAAKPGAAKPAPAATTGPGGRKAMSKMRKAIALNLQTSKQTVPHFYLRATINADPLFTFYKAQKPATGCTLNDVILLAVGRCVGEFPAFRSRIDGNDVVETPAANIGVAVSVADGLVVPVITNVHSLTLAQLAPEARRIVESARNGKIENMGKGVFTISNMGMLGVEEFAAIINPPESGILAIAAVREAVIVKEGSMRAGRVMTLTLSVDHRVVDGALAAQFMARLKELLESPEKLTT